MEKKDLRIVFMGTPDFAVESLRALVEQNYRIAGVVTMPDKPAGRGYKVQYSAVKAYALEQGLPLLQPEKLKDPVFIEALKAWKADVQIVVAFRMLPEIVWSMPHLGTINLHASLLPQYRGAAPINWAIIHGETETGVTTFFLTHEIDTGNIILQEKIAIGEQDTVGVVHDKLMYLGASLVLKTVDVILQDAVTPINQRMLLTGDTVLTPAPKITKESCRIDWSNSTKAIYDFVRGLNPYPAAWTEIEMPDGKVLTLKVFETEKVFANHSCLSGTVQTDYKTSLEIAVKDGYVRLLSVQQAGKKRMMTREFLRGYR
jgi:methionyl-tRNA formyltransferase